mgnify:FL=1|tara:strand:+ start:1374 stop:3596 length:2223 start_codon:yes stop_codon:yes gene_type:complete
MNPLNRRMFRQPGASRRPTGILASSPQLANTVANRQPVRMANGGTNTYTAAVQRAVQAGDKRALQELAKPVNYGAAARTPDGQNALRLARQALAQSTRISTDTAVDAPISDAERMAANRSNLAALRAAQGLGQGATVPATIDLPLSEAEQNAATRSNLAAFRAKQGLDQGATVPATVSTEPSTAMEQIKRAFMYPGEVLGFRVPDDAPGKPNPIGQGIRNFVFGTEESQSPVQSALRSADDAIVRGTSAAGDAIQNLEKGIISGFIPKPTGTALADAQAAAGAIREGFPGRSAGTATVSDMEGGVAQGLPLTIADTPAEVLAKATSTSTSTDSAKGRQVSTVDPNKETSTGDKAGSTVANTAIDTITSKLTSLLTGDVEDPSVIKKKVPSSQATNPEAADAFAVTYGQYADPEEVNLEKIDNAIKDTFGDKKDFTDAKRDAFYMNLIKAGLAIAAGESENAITNIAKGLSLGIDAYGKDMKDLNEQEREDEKERRVFRAQMIRDERTANIAMAAAKNQWTAADNRFKQADAQFKKTDEWNRQKYNSDMSFARQSLAINMLPKIAQLEIAGRTLDEKVRNNLATEAINEMKTDSVALRIAKKFGWIDSDNNITALGKQQAGDELQNNILEAELAKSKGTVKTGPKAPDRDRFIMDQLGKTDQMDLAREQLQRSGIKNPTSQDFEAFFGSQYDRISSGQTSAAPQQGTQSLAVGSVVTQGGKKFRVTAVDAQGNVTGSEEIK